MGCMAEREQLDSHEPATVVETRQAPADTGVLRLQRLAGNQAVTRMLSVQRDGPPATQQEADDVVTLMPVMEDIDTLVSATEAECGRWNAWRGVMQGDLPGAAAYQAMHRFKESVRAKGLDPFDERVQAVCGRRLTADDRQLLTEMYTFSLSTTAGVGGDAPGLAKVFGVQARPLRHKYTLKVAYSTGPKAEVGIGVGYTVRSAGIFYTNDFGMAYNKPVNMRSGVVSFGPSAGASVYSVGMSGEGTDESLVFWQPNDFETDFSVTKVAAGASVIGKVEAKLIEEIRVSSDRHPPLLFDMMAGSSVAPDFGGELGGGVGAGVELEKGRMVGGENVGQVSVTTPTLDQARQHAEQAKIVPPQDEVGRWRVINTTTVPFATGHSDLYGGEASNRVFAVADAMAAWHRANPDGELRVEVIGQASPRWRHPQQGHIPDDLNQKLSEQRARNTKDALRGALWSTDMEIDASGSPGPTLDLDEERAKASGTGAMHAKAELADPDNDDAGYRVAVITVWAKKR
jgi:outer membrane protein OmpA-like peptidoglycan-associated protein